MRRLLVIILTGLAGVFGGCTTSNTVYYWGDYESSLYDYYKHPDKLDTYVISLQEVVQNGEKDNKVPPGLYAEYGYALLVQGNREQALIYFRKEKQRWPESAYFMQVMIENAQSNGSAH